jgi:hypothetical protein
VGRSRGCHIWIIGNEPNHEMERPNGRLILPHQYAQAYMLCRKAIKSVPGHADDEVLVAGPAPWNATTTYPGNEKGDWVRYFVHVLAALPADACDGLAIHTYTHTLDPGQISRDFFHTTPGYRHLRNEFRSYRDFMNAIPDRFRHLPVFITETDPTTRGRGWELGHNVGWVRAAYREIAEWNRDPAHQPIQALVLYRWPVVPDQPEWSISNRQGIIEDFRQALAIEPAAGYALRLPVRSEPPVVLTPGNLLPPEERWQGLVVAPLGLNLRSGPSTQHSVLQILPDETAVMVLAELDEWLYVMALGQQGYVHNSFVLRPTPDEGPTEPLPTLRDRPELMGAPLTPPAEQQITLPPDAPWIERAVASTWNQYGALATQLAAVLQIDPAVAIAVLAVESGGRAFNEDGRLLIRFENHIFFDEWGKVDPERFAEHFRFDLESPWHKHEWRSGSDQEWQEFHGDQAAEWDALTLAREQFDNYAALRSISMGLPQVMGFNHLLLGYATVQEMFDAFAAGEHAQVIGFFDFVNAHPGRLDALRRGDYLAFAASYNGDGQAQLYATLIQDAISVFQRMRATPPASSEAKAASDEAAQLPAPEPLPGGSQVDPELYAAWRDHVLDGFAHNQALFERLTEAFMGPYHATVWMYRLMFAVGLSAFVAAAVLSLWTGQPWFGVVFGSLGIASFLTYFLSHPLRALEENLNFITWLGIIYNSYWTRMVYAMNQETVQQDLEDITEDFVNHMERLVDKSAALNQNRPGLR